MANEYIDKNFSDYFQIYTDGSVQANLDSGIGAVWRDPGAPFAKETMRANSRRGKCTTSVELEAIVSALDLIITKGYKKKRNFHPAVYLRKDADHIESAQ